MEISIIVAMTKNRVIGLDNTIPWHISEDLKNFKRITTENTIIMGRNTYESIGKPLPNRENIVVSKTMDDKNPIYNKLKIVRSIDEAIDYAQSLEKKIFVIGGAEIYSQTIDVADKLLVSYVKEYYKGNKYFPELKPYDWPIGFVKDYGEFIFMVRHHWK